MKFYFALLIIVIAAGVAMAGGKRESFHTTVDYVDMNRFSGDWYVIGLIPTPFEKDAANGVENYSINDEGIIRVEYTYRKGSPNGKEKIMYQKGWIYNSDTNAEWRVRPLWPLKLPYYILELAEDYSYTVIGTNNYKYLWIMARKPYINNNLYSDIVDRMEQRGFNPGAIIKMEQSW